MAAKFVPVHPHTEPLDARPPYTAHRHEEPACGTRENLWDLSIFNRQSRGTVVLDGALLCSSDTTAGRRRPSKILLDPRACWRFLTWCYSSAVVHAHHMWKAAPRLKHWISSNGTPAPTLWTRLSSPPRWSLHQKEHRRAGKLRRSSTARTTHHQNSNPLHWRKMTPALLSRPPIPRRQSLLQKDQSSRKIPEQGKLHAREHRHEILTGLHLVSQHPVIRARRVALAGVGTM